MRKLLLMSTCLLTWTAIPLHAQTQPDAGLGPSQDVRPPSQTPTQERMQPKGALGEGAGTRARGTEQGQAEQEQSRGQEPAVQRKEVPDAAQKARDPAQPNDNAATGQRSPETPKSKRANAPETGRQQTDESGRKPQPDDGEAAGKRRANVSDNPSNPENTKARAESDQTGQRGQKLQNGESPAKAGDRTGTEPNRTEGARGEVPKGTTSGDRGASATGGPNRGSVRAEGKVSLDERQANDLHSRIVDRYRGESTHVDVDLSVGVALPAAVRLRPVPTEIVSEYPEFRDYDFFVEDDEVVIVEPGTRQIVEVVGGGGGRRNVGVREGGPRLGRDRIEEITRVIASDRAALAEGGRGPMLRAPADAVLRPLTDRIASGMPDAAAYGYFVDREGRVVVVDRSNREVLDLVE